MTWRRQGGPPGIGYARWSATPLRLHAHARGRLVVVGKVPPARSDSFRNRPRVQKFYREMAAARRESRELRDLVDSVWHRRSEMQLERVRLREWRLSCVTPRGHLRFSGDADLICTVIRILFGDCEDA
jgi:hypothetical protein